MAAPLEVVAPISPPVAHHHGWARLRRRSWALPIAVLFGSGLRLWGIGFGLPAIYRPDEDVLVGRAMGVLQGVIDPHFADWPHLYIYISAAWLAILRPIFPLLGEAAPYLALRLLDAAIGTATIFVVYRFGSRAYGQTAGLVAAIGMAVAFLAVRDSHFATIDTPLTFASMLGIGAAYRLADNQTGRQRMAAGALLGVAAGIKYNGALVFASLVAAQGLQFRFPRRALTGLVVVGLSGVAAFAITSPFLLVDLGAFASGIRNIFSHLAAARQPEIGYIHIPRLALWYGLDPPLFLLGLAGLAYAAVRRTRPDWILVAFVLGYYALIGSGHMVFVRYADPLIPPLVILGARALVAACQRLEHPRLVLGAALAIAIIPAAAHDLAYDTLIQQTDTRTQAFDWLRAHVPARARVATLYFAGPMHDQAMIDRRGESHGAIDAYVASFLQNRLQNQYTVYELAESDLATDVLPTLRLNGVDYAVYSPIAPSDGCATSTPLQRALEAKARLVATFTATGGRCTDAVFDPIDGYYVPLSGYEYWARPGPLIQVFDLRAFRQTNDPVRLPFRYRVRHLS
ncbi:MAG: glycosyltransferase family 39 protein [Candidatus Dormibacteraeota bacterium]|nr:glycosyltransferase family 39 protein [Candidatus Dormibacteraeota bacterium]